MTIVEIVVDVLPIALSVIALIFAKVTKNKKMATKSIEQIKSEAQAKYDKYVAKQCKKNNVEQSTNTEQSNYY